MSAIFKNRKIPRHLIIEEESYHRRKSRGFAWKLIFWVVGFALVIWFGMQYLTMLTP